MAKSKRNIGAEILQGLREIKRGEVGRVINVPDITGIREKRDFRRPGSLNCSAFRCARYKIGNRGVVLRRGQHERF